MTRIHLIAATAILAIAGIAAPALAASQATAPGNTPFCPGGTDTDYNSRIDALSSELGLSTKLGASVDEWAGCLKVTTIVDGKSTVAFYDPDTFKLIATI